MPKNVDLFIQVLNKLFDQAHKEGVVIKDDWKIESKLDFNIDEVDDAQQLFHLIQLLSESTFYETASQEKLENYIGMLLNYSLVEFRWIYEYILEHFLSLDESFDKEFQVLNRYKTDVIADLILQKLKSSVTHTDATLANSLLVSFVPKRVSVIIKRLQDLRKIGLTQSHQYENERMKIHREIDSLFEDLMSAGLSSEYTEKILNAIRRNVRIINSSFLRPIEIDYDIEFFSELANFPNRFFLESNIPSGDSGNLFTTQRSLAGDPTIDAPPPEDDEKKKREGK